MSTRHCLVILEQACPVPSRLTELSADRLAPDSLDAAVTPQLESDGCLACVGEGYA